jgi:hypothetical protein
MSREITEMKENSRQKRTLRKKVQKDQIEEFKKISGAESFIKKQEMVKDLKESKQFFSNRRQERHQKKKEFMREMIKTESLKKQMGKEAFRQFKDQQREKIIINREVQE